ncbi:MAG: T9SS type A sorting domain-containing protein [Tannerellaceae bacterium]|jgi:hypothetical protein|nr:T9SS type A sorting domain-containing protein [Tannerellaceae bacterium]
MERKDYRFIVLFLVACVLFVASFPVRSQIEHPSSWPRFVNDTLQNVMVRDTFLFQSFEEAETDTWKYTTNNATRFNASSEGINGQGGNYSLKLPSGSNVTFNDFQTPIYKDVMIRITFGAKNLNEKESLTVKANRENGFLNRTWAIAQSNNYMLQYREKSIGDDGGRINPIQVTSNPKNIQLITSSLKANGFFCIDSALVQGDIPAYSLFEEEGLWGDTARWSHLPPARHRKALINGGVTVNSTVSCQQASIGNGYLHVAEKGRLTLDSLTLFDMSASFTSLGEVIVKKEVTVYKTFDEPGKWYFVSFPFDVYLDGIDQRFQLEDDLFTGEGNYLYVLSYNGKKRSESNSSQGNWEALSAGKIGDQPVFSRGKGYLIALDNKANDQTIAFSSTPGKLPKDFGQHVPIPVQAFAGKGTKEQHAGWYLCGNPLATSLSLSQIAGNADLDGNIYVHEGSSFKAYPIGGDYKLPPYSAFFIKAKKSTALQLKNVASSRDEALIGMSNPAESNVSEPEITSSVSIAGAEGGSVRSHVAHNYLYLENLPQEGHIRLLDFMGRKLLQRTVPAGSSSVHLPVPAGFYILVVESAGYRTQHKCLITG